MPVDERLFYELVRDKESNAMIDGFRQSGNAELKRKLPALIFQAMFDETTSKSGKKGAWRKQSATRLTGLVVLDIDHVEHPKELIDEWMSNIDFEKWGILFIYITPSGKGIKVVFKANLAWGNLADNQIEMAKLLGVEADESGKDASRMSFICKEEDIQFIDQELFTYENKEFAEKYNAQYRNGNSNPTHPAPVAHQEVRQVPTENRSLAAEPLSLIPLSQQADSSPQSRGAARGTVLQAPPLTRGGAQGAEGSILQAPPLMRGGAQGAEGLLLQAPPFTRGGALNKSGEQLLQAPPLTRGGAPNKSGEQLLQAPPLTRGGAQGAEGSNAPLNFKGIPYTEIIAKWWEKQGGVPQEGERNVKLYQLAVNLRAITDNNKELLLQIMPRLGLDEQEFQSIIDSACKEQPKGISKALKEVLESLNNSPLSIIHSPFSIEEKLWFWGEQIEQLSAEYPILKDICKGLKKNQYPAAVFVGGLFLMTLMTRCTYRFYHRPEELRRLNGSTMIIGDPASGKSFATRLYKLLMTPIFAADKVGRDAINAYRELMKTKGANKEKPKKPKVVVRIHPARTSNAQFIQDMINAVEVVDGEEIQLHMLTFDTELDNTLSIQKGGSWIDKLSLELKAFHNEEDGQAYSNVDSIMQDFIVTWNYVYTGTPIALKKKVNESNFGSGLATRLTCIPLPSTNFEMMERVVTVDYDSDQRLKEWALLLDKMKGELSVQKIVDELYGWTARRMADAQENDSKADEMLLKRCAYHGLNYSAPFIVLRHWNELHQDGEFWCGEFNTDETDWQLVELLTNIHFACQKHYFGAMAEMYFDNRDKEASVNHQRHQKTVEAFNRLPEEFTTDDVMRCFNLKSETAAYTRVGRMQKDGLAVKKDSFNKNGHTKSIYRKTGVVMIG